MTIPNDTIEKALRFVGYKAPTHYREDSDGYGCPIEAEWRDDGDPGQPHIPTDALFLVLAAAWDAKEKP